MTQPRSGQRNLRTRYLYYDWQISIQYDVSQVLGRDFFRFAVRFLRPLLDFDFAFGLPLRDFDRERLVLGLERFVLDPELSVSDFERFLSDRDCLVCFDFILERLALV